MAVVALSKLEALAERNVPLRGELSADFLGLLASFWGSGVTARGYAQSVLERMEGCFESPLHDCIEEAIEHQYRHAQFATADRLREMLQHY